MREEDLDLQRTEDAPDWMRDIVGINNLADVFGRAEPGGVFCLDLEEEHGVPLLSAVSLHPRYKGKRLQSAEFLVVHSHVDRLDDDANAS